MKKRVLSLLMAVLMVLNIAPLPVLAAGGVSTADLEFDVSSPAGYVTVTFADHGVRPESASIQNEELYGTAVGTIIPETRVPYVAGDTMADVTVRLLKALDMEYASTGTTKDGF